MRPGSIIRILPSEFYTDPCAGQVRVVLKVDDSSGDVGTIRSSDPADALREGYVDDWVPTSRCELLQEAPAELAFLVLWLGWIELRAMSDSEREAHMIRTGRGEELLARRAAAAKVAGKMLAPEPMADRSMLGGAKRHV